MSEEKPVDRDRIVAELRDIAGEHDGLLCAEHVLRRAEAKKNILHDLFEWDDTVAAYQHRLRQAREIIRVNVQVITECDDPVKVFVSLPSDHAQPGGGYREFLDVLRTPAWQEEYFSQALAELTRVRRQYSQLKQLAPIFAAMDKVVKRAEKDQARRVKQLLLPLSVSA